MPRQETPDFAPLTAQMLRLIEGRKPAVERAAVEVVSESELLGWVADAHRIQSAKVATAFDRTWVAFNHRPRLPDDTATSPDVSTYLRDNTPVYPRRFFVTQSDATFEGYFRRMKTVVGDDFGFQVPGLEGANWTAFGRYQRIISPLLAQLGLHTARFNSFFGDYRRTPFGVHFDPHHLHTFQYVALGSKVLRAWLGTDLIRTLGEDATVDILRDPMTAHDRLPTGLTLTGEPGFLLYWPGGYVHCLEANGPSAGLGIVIDENVPSAEQGLLDELALLRLPKRRTRRTATGDFSRWRKDAFERDRRWVTSQVACADFWRTVAFAQLLVRSRLGARAVPPLRDVPDLLNSERLRMTNPNLSQVVYHCPYEKATLLAVNGHGAEVPWTTTSTHANIIRLVHFINRHETIAVADTITRFSRAKPLTPDFIRSILHFLVSTAAFDRCPA
jgi:hypothetical protein